LFLSFAVCTAVAQNIPTPKEHFGFTIGDNYQLANFTQTEAYFKKLAQASDRAKYTVIGKTEEGRDQFMLIVTSPENHKKLEEYKQISQQMGNAGITPEQAAKKFKPGWNSIWEVLNHLMSWRLAILERIEGREYPSPENNFFSPITDQSASAWNKTLETPTGLGRTGVGGPRVAGSQIR